MSTASPPSTSIFYTLFLYLHFGNLKRSQGLMGAFDSRENMSCCAVRVFYVTAWERLVTAAVSTSLTPLCMTNILWIRNSMEVYQVNGGSL